MICIKQVERKIIEPLAGSAGNQYVLRGVGICNGIGQEYAHKHAHRKRDACQNKRKRQENFFG